ncbi:MAG: 4Fe-4S dicluster domain-containing protein [Ilumatobacteraceae bacterium]
MKPRTEWVPSAEQMEHWPEVSGNDINGLGEADVRPPTPIMWHPPEMIAHGAVQTWFWAQGPNDPEVAAVRAERQRVINMPNAPIADERRDISPADAVARITEAAHAAGADIVGFVQPRPEWVFEGYELEYPWMVMLGIGMDPEKIKLAPEITAAVEVASKYAKGWAVAREVSNWIRSQGWRSEPHSGPEAGAVLSIPAALEAGFGQLGKHGSIISRQLGSSFRLATVFTDLPLIPSQPVDIGVDDFCLVCKRCVEDCPPAAIIHEKQMVRGEMKWYVDFDKCMPYFAEHHGCAICIGVCPWTKPGRAQSISDTMLRRRVAKPSRTPD